MGSVRCTDEVTVQLYVLILERTYMYFLINVIIMSEWARRVYCLTRHIIGHFGDESFQAIDCAGTGNQKQGNKTSHTP